MIEQEGITRIEKTETKELSEEDMKWWGDAWKDLQHSLGYVRKNALGLREPLYWHDKKKRRQDRCGKK